MGDLSDINSIITTIMFFLSGTKVTDKQIHKTTVKEQLLQVDPEMNLVLSGKNRFCNCNLIGLSVPMETRTASVKKLSYFPGKCSGSSWPLFTKDYYWKGLHVKEISLSRVQEITDGYVGDLTLTLKSSRPDSETYFKKFPIIFNGREESKKIVYTCDPLINRVHAGKQELCTLLDGTYMKCMGFDGREVVGDEIHETGDLLEKVPFSEDEITEIFHAGKNPEEVFCVQFKSNGVECRRAASNTSYPLYGNPGKQRILELVLNHTSDTENFSESETISFKYDKIEKFAAVGGASVDLSEINRTPVGEYLNRENTFLALYEDGSIGVLSPQDKYHHQLFLPANIKVKKIINYNVSSACVLSHSDEIYCWGLLGGVITTNPINFFINKTALNPGDAKLPLFATPIKVPVTQNRAQWMGKVEFHGGAKVLIVKSHYVSPGFVALPSICATLSDGKFSCFPQVLNDEGTKLGQMTEFPEIGKKMAGYKVKDFWLWDHLVSSDQRDPLPIVLLENHELIFASGGSFVEKWSLSNLNSHDVIDVKADPTTVNVLFQDGQLVAFPASQGFSRSVIGSADFNQSSSSSDDKYFIYDYGDPVKAIFPMKTKKHFSGVLCALTEKSHLKCSGTDWGYGDSVPRLNQDPQWRGKNFPEINFGKI